MEQNLTETELALEGLQPGHAYLVGVAAQNDVGAGAFSESAIFIVPLSGMYVVIDCTSLVPRLYNMRVWFQLLTISAHVNVYRH